ncbi:MAG TPA: TIGR03936 family radical SAM-associated protein [Acidimicrobiales bacterium]
MRLRFRFSKVGKIRWTSHRDLARMWERAFRRVELPLAYTVGFSPRPKVSFGLALPTGYESVAEYLDVELDPSRVAGIDVFALPPLLSAALPAGVDVTAAAVIDDKSLSLQHEVTSSEWDVEFAAGTDAARLRELAGEALAATALVVTRERKGHAVEEDVRPAILSLTVVETTGVAPTLLAELAAQPRALRPSEMLAAVAPDATVVRVRRLTQWISRADGAREEPLAAALPPDALADAPPAIELERV